VDYFYSAAEHRSRGALWPSFALARISSTGQRGIRVKIRGAVKVCRDPNDDIFLECAALAKADLLVAGDKDLLTLGVYKRTRIVTPSEYVRAG
jgi:predicted nucleic acid-binding protein